MATNMSSATLTAELEYVAIETYKAFGALVSEELAPVTGNHPAEAVRIALVALQPITEYGAPRGTWGARLARIRNNPDLAEAVYRAARRLAKTVGAVYAQITSVPYDMYYPPPLEELTPAIVGSTPLPGMDVPGMAGAVAAGPGTRRPCSTVECAQPDICNAADALKGAVAALCERVDAEAEAIPTGAGAGSI